jgi:hypothetical protein
MQESSPIVLITLEPKYCEGCGAIRLRPAGSAAVYCERCARRWAEMAPAPASSGAAGRCA